MREARMVLPDHRIVYVGDDAGFPYGEWEENALVSRILNLFSELMERYTPSVAIIACNTASTLILPELRKRFDIPFVGIVPAIKPAAERTSSGLVSILATPGTVNRPRVHNLIAEFASDIEVNLVGSKKLAKLAEDYMQGAPVDQIVLRDEINPCFIEKNAHERTDIVLLGCTHYPFLVNEMRKVAPWPVDWLDPAEAVARHAMSVASREPLNATGKKDIALMTSGSPNAARERLLRSFGLTIERSSLGAASTTATMHP